MNGPLVSVIIPCYNHQRFVESCLTSVIEQTYKSIELIIIDDCSQDDSAEIIRKNLPELQRKLARVEFEEHASNMGITKTLNQALKTAQGNYIKLLASDDMMHPKAIERLVSVMESHCCYDMLFSNGRYIPEDCTYQQALSGDWKRFYDSSPLPSRETLVSAIYLENFIFGGTVFLRKDTFEKYGLYDEYIPIEDWEYNLRVASQGMMGYVEDEIFFYRRVTTSISHINKEGAYKKRFDFMYNGMIMITEKYKSYVDDTVYFRKLTGIYKRYIEKAFLLRYLDKMKEIQLRMKELKVWNCGWQAKYILAYLGMWDVFLYFRNQIVEKFLIRTKNLLRKVNLLRKIKQKLEKHR